MAGLYDGAQCRVVGVEVAFVKRKLAKLKDEHNDTMKTIRAKSLDLVAAAKYNRMSEIRLVCQYAPERLDRKNRCECKPELTALHVAANKNSPEVVGVLLGAGMPVDVKDANGDTALHWTARNNSLEVAELLLAAKAAADSKNKNGATILHMAATKNSLEVTELLLSRLGAGAVEIKNTHGKTPLQLARDKEHEQMVARLVEVSAYEKIAEVDAAGDGQITRDEWYAKYGTMDGFVFEVHNPPVHSGKNDSLGTSAAFHGNISAGLDYLRDSNVEMTLDDIDSINNLERLVLVGDTAIGKTTVIA